MSEVYYDLVIKGIRDGEELETVKQRLAKLFNASAKSFDRLDEALIFKKRVTLLKKLKRETADRNKSALEQSGLLCDIETSLQLMDKEKVVPMYTCPACQHQQKPKKDGTDACEECGVVGSKYSMMDQRRKAIQKERGKRASRQKYQELAEKQVVKRRIQKEIEESVQELLGEDKQAVSGEPTQPRKSSSMQFAVGGLAMVSLLGFLTLRYLTPGGPSEAGAERLQSQSKAVDPEEYAKSVAQYIDVIQNGSKGSHSQMGGQDALQTAVDMTASGQLGNSVSPATAASPAAAIKGAQDLQNIDVAALSGMSQKLPQNTVASAINQLGGSASPGRSAPDAMLTAVDMVATGTASVQTPTAARRNPSHSVSPRPAGSTNYTNRLNAVSRPRTTNATGTNNRYALKPGDDRGFCQTASNQTSKTYQKNCAAVFKSLQQRDFNQALATSGKTTDPFQQAQLTTKVLGAQIQVNDRAGAIQNLPRLIKIIQAIKQTSQRAQSISALARLYAFLGAKEKAQRTFATALKTAGMISDEIDTRATAYSKIAIDQASLRDFNHALVTTDNIELPYLRANTIKQIAQLQVGSGEQATLSRTLNRAIQASKRVTDDGKRRRLLFELNAIQKQGARIN